jgi:hypothetical protein
MDSKHMKNANVFVDVDLTLVDANGKLLDGAREGLLALKDAGCHLFLWSTAGADYCRKVADLHRLAELFEGFTAKPDIVIDDMPSTCVAPFVFSVQQEESWPALARRIIDKHVD